MNVRDEMLASLGGEPATYPKADAWGFDFHKRAGVRQSSKWHFMRRTNGPLVALCGSISLQYGTDLVTDGYKSKYGACAQCLAKFWKLVEAGTVERPS